jgi:hypothetical protein
MQNHVWLVASNHPSEQRGQLVRLMEMARKSPGFDINRSVRAREVRKTAADGSETKVTVLFIRTGKESVLETIENCFLSKGDRRLAKKIFETAFPEWAGSQKKTFLQSLFWQDRIAVKTLDDRVPPYKKGSAAFRLAWQEASVAFGKILESAAGKRFASETSPMGSDASLPMRSCLGLSARCRKKEADDLLDGFIELIRGLQSADCKLNTLETRQRLVEQARRFATAWTGQKQRNPKRHRHTVCTGNLGVLDKLVTCFDKSFPGQGRGQAA